MTDPRMTPTNDAPVTVEQCPFCGGRAQLDRYDPDPANPEMALNCMGECDGIFIFPKIAAGDTAALVQRWNTRLAALASAPAEPLPDIGPDPFKGPREDDRYEGSRLRLRAAYVQQQKGVPDQTALVWRYDLGTVLEMAIRLKSILADADEPASAPAGDGVEEAVARAICRETLTYRGIAELRYADQIVDDEWEDYLSHARAAILAAALARPRAAVGERNHLIEIVTEAIHDHAADDAGSARDHATHAVTRILALQSPPAKVEQSNPEQSA